MKENNEKQQMIKIMSLGNGQVGKSSFILRFTDNKFKDKINHNKRKTIQIISL